MPARRNTTHFIHTPMMLADKQGGDTAAIMDEGGLIYVLHEEAAIRKNNDLKFPLVVRSNIYDCVD